MDLSREKHCQAVWYVSYFYNLAVEIDFRLFHRKSDITDRYILPNSLMQLAVMGPSGK